MKPRIKRWIRPLLSDLRCIYRRVRRPRVIPAVGGVLLPIEPDRYSAEMLDALYRGWYEIEEARILRKVLGRSDVVLELGAGIGYLSTLCCRMISDHTKIHAYEANPELIPIAQDTYRLNGVSPHLHHAAVGKGAGEIEFFIHDDFWLSSTVACEAEKRRTVGVPAVPFNEIVREIEPSFLICDIEGAEDGLFSATDLSCVRKILIEVHPQIIGKLAIRNLIETLFAAGFFLDTGLSVNNVLYFHKESGCQLESYGPGPSTWSPASWLRNSSRLV